MQFKSRLFYLTLLSLAFAQFPVDLNRDEVSDPYSFSTVNDTEYILTVIGATNTNWSVADSESATLVVVLDGDWDSYNQDIVLYAGEMDHIYYCSLGPISSGDHSIQFKFDYTKSSSGAELIHIESIDLMDISAIDMDEDVFKYSPILYGRDLLAWNESTRTDIPLIMWHDLQMIGADKRITYSLIFTNEDSRVGIGLAELLYNYGRTTDIEWVYEVLLSPSGDILSEVFQGASHITTNFEGDKIGSHPILKNATLNCNFTDVGTSDYKFFLSPILTADADHTREILMDENPWSYRIMAEELINEGRYEETANPGTVEISDVRNYLIIEFAGSATGANTTLGVAAEFYEGCETYISHHNSAELSHNYNGGINRTSIELPENFDPYQLHELGFIAGGTPGFNLTIENISRLFYLDAAYQLIDIAIEFSPLFLNENNTENWLLLNGNDLNLDCFSVENGSAECDDCGVCEGGNEDMDECGICFGNNEAMDCNGECYGPASEDGCGVCDEDPDNDNTSCSGCNDENALNFDESALFDDGSCEYADNYFLVPEDYSTIQTAIYYAGDGDTVKVGPGIYYENINFLGKSIVLTSHLIENQYNPEETIISAVDSLSTVTIENAVDAELIGFSITNGYGRGVSFEDFISLASDEEAFDSLLTQVIRGGGISVGNSTVDLRYLDIFNNTARNVGAGIGLINSNATIFTSQFNNNTVIDGDALGGGGVAINGGYTEIINTNIYQNTVGSNMYSLSGGGGILCGFSFGNEPLQLILKFVNIYDNSANIGAGLGALSGNINMTYGILAGNVGDYGSAISLGEPLGLVVGDINLNINKSTIANNSGLMGIGLINSAHLNAVNSIFWNNGDVEFTSLPNNDQLNLDLRYCDAEELWPGEGNINSDPLFLYSESWWLTLSLESPCIDAGTDDPDNDGIPDWGYHGSAPDMGRFEFYIIGDVDENYVLDVGDLIICAEIILGYLIPSDNQLVLADVNHDWIIDIIDVISIINLILNQP